MGRSRAAEGTAPDGPRLATPIPDGLPPRARPVILGDMESPFPDPEIPTFDAASLMIPPWIKYPAIPRASIGWRMGEGEGYWDDFRLWWNEQEESTRQRVRTAYTEPSGWSGFYERV